MPKVTATAAAAAVLLALTLTGCAGAGEAAGNERTAPTTSDVTPSADATPDAPKLTETEQEWIDLDTWDQYDIPKDVRLTSARLACEEFADGKTTQEMSLPGVPAELTDFFANSSQEWFCPIN